MNTFKRIVKNFLSLSLGEIISRIFGFAGVIYLARVLGVENFGKIIFAQAILVYFLLITDLGLTTLGIREIAQFKNKISVYVNNIITLRLTLAVAAFCLLFLFSSFISKSQDINYLIIIYGLSLFPMALLFDWVFQGIEKMEYIGISRILDKAFYLILILLVIRNTKQLFWVPYLWLAGCMASSSFLIFIFVKQGRKIRFKFDIDFWNQLLRQALPMGASFIMLVVYYSFGTVMLGFMKGYKVVGWYNAAYKIILLLVTGAGVFMKTIFPLMARYHKESKSKLSILIRNSIRFLALISFPMGIIVTFFAGKIIKFMYGMDYGNAVVVLQMLIWSVVIIYNRCVFEQSFLACGQQKRYMYGVAIGCLTNIALNLMLIPPFGLKGAALASIIGELIFSLYMFYYFRIVSLREILNIVKPVLFAASMMTFFLYFTYRWNFFISIPMAILIFLELLYLIGGLQFERLENAEV